MEDSNAPSIVKAAQVLKNAESILITAGAGMGVDSGLPDFRGKDGFWTAYKAFENKFQFQDCANPRFLEKHPKLFWGFYGHRIELYRKTIPHLGFEILKKFTGLPHVKASFVATSNVDGQFQKAGFNEKKIYEVHGNIHYLQCTPCNVVIASDPYTYTVDAVTIESTGPLPECITCKTVMRPNLLMFGDFEWMSDRYDVQEAEYKNFLKESKKKKLVVIEIGAGVAIPTIRNMSEVIVNDNPNAYLIRINPRDLETSLQKTARDRYIPLKGNTLDILQQIEKQMV